MTAPGGGFEVIYDADGAEVAQAESLGSARRLSLTGRRRDLTDRPGATGPAGT